MVGEMLLKIRNLSKCYPGQLPSRGVLRNISLDLETGQSIALTGESGSGKSMTGRAILRLIRRPGIVEADHVSLHGDNLLEKTEKEMRSVRGEKISMVMQDPKFSLNPVMTVGAQIIEAYRLHAQASKVEAYRKSVEMLEAVAIRDPERVMKAYPHEMSGGMGQRIMIAMMLIPNPEILIADEPTSALDVSVQGQVLSIMDKLVKDRGMGLIFISHDLNLVSQFCDRVLIMYSGRIVEVCQADKLHEAQHPYTKGLLGSLPKFDQPSDRLQVLTRDPAWRDAPSVEGRT